MKSAFYIVGFLNVVLMGICGYLLLDPAGGAPIASFNVPKLLPSDHFSNPSVPLDSAPETVWDHAQPQAADNTSGALGASPFSVTRAASVSSAPEQPSSSRGSASSYAQDEPSRSSASLSNDDPRVKSTGGTPASGRSTGQDSSGLSIAAAKSSNPAVAKTPGTASDNDAQAAVSIPYAFTTSADGATREQAAALDRLQQNFSSTVTSQNQNPNDPSYAKTWQSAQAESAMRPTPGILAGRHSSNSKSCKSRREINKQFS